MRRTNYRLSVSVQIFHIVHPSGKYFVEKGLDAS